MTASSPDHARTGAELLVRELQIHGVEHVFCVPGESYLSVLDALYETPIQLTVCRQEGGAAMMAEAHGKLSGRPGVCFVTRGPGATNATPGLHVARQDSTPMLLFIGQVERTTRDREAFQEIDYRAFLGPLTKWSTEIDDPARIPEIVSRAFHVATSGRPGPVAISLPEDMLRETAAAAPGRPYQPIEAAPRAEDLDALARLMTRSTRPLVIVGGSRWDEQSVRDLQAFAERQALPVAVSFRRQDLYSADHPHFVGDLGVGANPRLVEYARAADMVVLIGGRLSELPSQNYTLLGIPSVGRPFVHVHPGADELGRLYRPDLAFNVSPRSFCHALRDVPSSATRERLAHVRAGRDCYEAWAGVPTAVPGEVNPGRIVEVLRRELPDDAIVCNGAGNYSIWLHRYFRFRRFGTQLAPTSGSMGYGVPAAIAAKRIHPERIVVALAGDGCFLMNGQEFATAVKYGLPVMIIVMDNGMYGTIRMHQEREYPGRVIGTALASPDFAALACAFGGYGERVTSSDEFLPAFRRSLQSGRPSIIHCVVDPQAITPTRSLDQIRDAALAGGGPG